MRIALELKSDADKKMVMAYLCKHTPLQTNFPVNLTCLIPTENPRSAGPSGWSCTRSSGTSSHFRLNVVTRRLELELEALNGASTSSKGFEIVFDALDEILAIVRKSDGKADAAAKIMARFKLSEREAGRAWGAGAVEWLITGNLSTRDRALTNADYQRPLVVGRSKTPLVG